MKALINKKTIIIASIAFLIALISIVSVNVFNSAGPVTGAANVVTRPVRALASNVARTFGSIFSAIYRYDELEARNDQLLQTIAKLQQDARDAVTLSEENDRLRALLEFSERHGGYLHEPATLEGWTSDNWTHSFTINRGYTNSNISEGMGVATEHGMLIGQVFYVGATSSIVITVLDTRFSAAAFVGGDSGERADADGTATVMGDFTQMRNGLLLLDHIDDDMTVITGSSVFTSGAGGVFPSGLTIGEVVRVSGHDSGIGRYASVMPMVNFDSIHTVFVILSVETTESGIVEAPESEIEE